MNSPNGSPSSVQGTAQSRAHLVRPAIRRASFARLALSGPSGSGKTWSALSMARVLAPDGPVVVVDTEEESSELYADLFEFQALQWGPPYDPRDLAATLKDLSRTVAKDGVVIVDSASHFWRGQGGTLDIADGRFGGWKTATPAQDDLVMSILQAPCHVIICTRAKHAYDVNETSDQSGRKKQEVVKLGLAPIQRDDFEYEMNVVGMIDMEHRIDIGKTRCPALAGKSYQANHEGELAQVYGDWLKGGAVMARQTEVDQVVLALNSVGDRDERLRVKAMFTDFFGHPDRLTEETMDEARKWTTEQTGVPFSDEGEALLEQAGTPQPEPQPDPPDTDADRYRRLAEKQVAGMNVSALRRALKERGLSEDGDIPARQERLAAAIAAELATEGGSDAQETAPAQDALGPVDEAEPEGAPA